MKRFKTLATGLVFSLFLVLAHAGVSLAEEHSSADIQMLRDASAALKASNPDLSEKLGKYADREAKEMEEDEEYERSEKK
jgi:hypothetical protein